jgi:hypothetical protein
MADDMMPAAKRCSKCGETKPANLFYKRAKSPDGIRPRCKTCCQSYDAAHRSGAAKRAAAWRLRNPGKQGERTKAWRESNPKKITEYRRATKGRAHAYAAQYHAAHAEKTAARKREYYKANPEKQTERTQKSRAKDIERCRQKSRDWQEKNKERARRNLVEWRASNPEACAAQAHGRRARKIEAQGSHTRAETISLLAAQHHLCANPYCRADLRHTRKALDHKVALACGGSNGIENLQWLCARCNSRKSTLRIDEWLNREAARAGSLAA